MLYDNALLIAAYLDGYRLMGDEGYRRVAEQTCDYLLREMHLPGGAFAAAQDADTVEGEGRYFAWSEADFRDALSPEDAGWAASVASAAPAATRVSRGGAGSSASWPPSAASPQR